MAEADMNEPPMMDPEVELRGLLRRFRDFHRAPVLIHALADKDDVRYAVTVGTSTRDIALIDSARALMGLTVGLGESAVTPGSIDELTEALTGLITRTRADRKILQAALGLGFYISALIDSHEWAQDDVRAVALRAVADLGAIAREELSR